MGDSPLGAWLREQGSAAAGSGAAAAADDRPKGWTADAEPELSGPLAGPWDADGGHPRRRRLRLLAGGAWAVVLVLGAVAVVGGAGSGGAPVGSDGPSAGGGEAAAATTAPSAGLPVDSDGVASADAPVPGAADDAGAPVGGESADAAPAPDAATAIGPVEPPAPVGPADAAVAAMAVREAFSDAAAPRFVDEAVAVDATGIGSPGGDLRVVTVAALVLEGGEGGWRGARQARYAVALGGPPTNPQPVGEPWPLADPVRPALGRGAPVAEPARIEAVAAALVAAGYAEVEVPALTLSAADPALLVADIVAVSPGGGERAPRTVLLTDGPAPVLLGADR